MMPRRRQRSTNNSNKRRATQSVSIAVLAKRDVAEKIAKARRARQARQRIPKELVRPATKAQRDDLRKHGFRTTDNGVVVDGPRDTRRKPIKGARLEIMRGGIIKTSVGQRRDFIIGFTRKEKREFARDPGAFEKKKVKELRSLFPLLKKSRRPQVRLQWGAYQATKDFTPTYFSAKYFASISPEEIRKVGKKYAQPRADKLTGLHIVVHVPKTKKKGTARRAKKGKKQ